MRGVRVALVWPGQPDIWPNFFRIREQTFAHRAFTTPSRLKAAPRAAPYVHAPHSDPGSAAGCLLTVRFDGAGFAIPVLLSGHHG